MNFLNFSIEFKSNHIIKCTNFNHFIQKEHIQNHLNKKAE